MNDLILLLPELYIALTAIGLLVGEVGYHGERNRIIHLTAFLGLGGALLQVLMNYNFGVRLYFGGTLVNDAFALYVKLILVVAAMVSIYASKKSHEVSIENRGEFCALVLGVTGFSMLAASSSNLLLILILLQAAGVLGYLLVAQKKRCSKAIEASVKKMAVSGLSLLFTGFGVLFLFSAAGSLDIYEIHKVVAQGGLPIKTITVAFTLILVGIGAQMCLFPAHLWGPDVYQGSAAPTAGFLSLVYRVTGFAVLVRSLVIMFAKNTETKGLWASSSELNWTWMVAVLAALTLLTGGLLAYRQRGVKRLLSALVVTQTGFLMLGLIALDEVGFSSLLYNLTGELFAVLGAYAALSYFFDRLDSDEFETMSGALARAVPEGVAFLFFLASIVGLPPFPGFIGKFTLVSAAIRHDWNILAFIAVFSSLLCIISVSRFMFSFMSDFRKHEDTLSVNLGHRILILSLLVPLLLLTVFSEWVLRFAGQSVQMIFW